jgi:hypothetical protein
VCQQLARDARERGHAHQDDERIDGRGQPRPVDPLAVLAAFVAGDDSERRRDAAVRERNACIGRRGDRRADARNDFEGHARGGERFGLLAAASEDERVAALETHHAAPPPRVPDEQRVDLLLRQRVVAAGLAREDPARARSFAQQAPVDEPVVDDDFCTA